MFLLAKDGRDENAVGAFRRYREYVRSHEGIFPPGAFALATSDWYFDPRFHRCPHDAWLESLHLSEPASGDRRERRSTALTLRLLGAYHDGYIELHYPRLVSYTLKSNNSGNGHGDWRYDEFRLSDRGNLIHEVEWRSDAIWMIEASDIEFTWLPISAS